jgi:hypothetical protein
MAEAKRTTARRSSSSATPKRSSSPTSRRTIAGLTNELATVRSELTRVDARNRRLAGGIDYAGQLLCLVAVLALFYVLLLRLQYPRR